MSSHSLLDNEQEPVVSKEMKHVIVRRMNWEEEKRRKNEEAVKYLEELFPFNPLEIEGVIVKLDATDYGTTSGADDYTEMTGTNPFKVPTLIVGDDDNNKYMVFKEEKEVITKDITERVHIMKKYYYDSNSSIYRKNEPIELPDHLRPLIVINKIKINKNKINSDNTFTSTTVNNIKERSININENIINNGLVNNFKNFKISERSKDLQEFLENNFKRGGICPLKDMRRYKGWRAKYRRDLNDIIDDIDICKSCGERWLKGCCDEYYVKDDNINKKRNNKRILMVFGWSLKA